MPPTVLRRTLGLAGLDIPVVELTGAAGGPRLTVLAGVHGCEYAPMAAVRRWIKALAGRELRGSVCAVPVLNLPAFRARTPFLVPDDNPWLVGPIHVSGRGVCLAGLLSLSAGFRRRRPSSVSSAG